MEKYEDKEGSTLLVTKDKVVLILNPFQFQALRHLLLKRNTHKEPESCGSFSELSEELLRNGVVSAEIRRKYSGTILSLFHLIKDKKHHEGD